MFASRAEVQDLKDLVKSMNQTVEDLSVEIKLLRQEVEQLRASTA